MLMDAGRPNLPRFSLSPAAMHLHRVRSVLLVDKFPPRVRVSLSVALVDSVAIRVATAVDVR